MDWTEREFLSLECVLWVPFQGSTNGLGKLLKQAKARENQILKVKLSICTLLFI